MNNREDFIKEVFRSVKNELEDIGDYNGNEISSLQRNKSLSKELEDYFDSQQPSTLSNKYFAKELFDMFSDCCEPDNCPTEEIAKNISKLWKEYQEENGNKNMVKKHSEEISNEGLASRVLSTALDDGAEVMTRIAAKQLAKSVVEPVTAMLIAGLDLENNDSTRSKIAKFLTSDVGLGLASFALSFGVEKLPLPALAQNVVKSLGRELRVQGEMAIADPIVELVGAPLRAMLTEKVLALPIPGLGLQLPQNTPSNPDPVTVTVVESKEKSPAKKPVKKPKTTKPAKKSPKKKASGIKVTVVSETKKNSGSSDSVN